MKKLARLCLSLALLVFSGLVGRPALAQVRASWFDINPSRSNTDDSDPNGASGGRVNHVGASSDLSRVYAATEWGGLYMSFTQGNTWVKVNTYSPTTTWDVKVDPRNSAHVFATAFFDGRAVRPQSGISISNDDGNTWRAVDIPGLNRLNCVDLRRRNEPSAWQIAINPRVPSNIFVGTSCGLARSFDNGVNWDFVDPSPRNGAEQIYAVVAHGEQIIDVIGDNGHFRSTDNGATWSPTNAGAGPGPGNSGQLNSLAASPREDYVLFASNGNNIWESDNGGTSWPTSLALPLRSGGVSNVQGRIPFIKTNQLSTSNQFDVWYGDINLFKTTATTPSTLAPGGAPRLPLALWANMQEEGHWDNGDLLFDPRFSAGACPRIFSNDGGVYLNQQVNNPRCQSPNWEQPTITPHATWVWGFDGRRISPGIHALTYGLQDNGGYAATLVAEGHNPPGPNWNNFFCCDVSDNTQDGGSFISLDGSFGSGRAFRLKRRNSDGGGESEISSYPSAGGLSAFDSGEGNVRFGSNAFVVNSPSGVFFTNDITSGSIGWTGLSAPTAPAPVSSSGNLKLASLGGRPNVFYHTSDGNPANPGVIFRSSLVGGTGGNWAPVQLPVGIGSVNVYDVDPNDGNRIIISGINVATGNFEMWITRNLGASWDPLPQLNNLMVGATAGGPATWLNQPSQGLRMAGGTFAFGNYWQPSLLKFNPIDPSTIIAGGVDSGIFLSLDDGNNWQPISNAANPNSNSPHVPRPLDAYFSPGRFNASTNAFDVWVATRGAGIMKVVVEQIP